MTFRADNQARKTNTMLKGLTKGDVNPGDNLTWDDEIANIPAVVPTKLGGGCKNIDVRYLLTVSIVIKLPLYELNFVYNIICIQVAQMTIVCPSPQCFILIS